MFDDDADQDYPIREGLRDVLWVALAGVVLMVVGLGCVVAVPVAHRYTLRAWLQRPG